MGPVLLYFIEDLNLKVSRYSTIWRAFAKTFFKLISVLNEANNWFEINEL